jgi:ElaB/YqjD/DUF883 family membrane-anchored ribosome-binding protein
MTMNSEAKTTTQAAERAHNIVDGVADKAADLETRTRAGLGTAAAKAHEARTEIERDAKQAIGSIEKFVTKQPVTTVALAFVAGLIATALLRR